MGETPKKHAGGRPLTYDSKFHPGDFIERAKKGDSLIEVCAAWLISKETLLQWAKKHREFSDAVKTGKALVEQHYITIARDNIMTSPKKFNTGLFALLARNIVRWDKPDSNVNVTLKKKKRPLKGLTDEQLDAL